MPDLPRSAAAAGWYPTADPEAEGYWDGSAWTGHRRVEALPNRDLVIAGYVGALLIPLVGFVIALAVGVRSAGPRSQHGRRIFAVAMLMTVVYAIALTGGISW